ncbi:MAG: hypothetical protein Q9215_000713 [Flavoplaca cf. flavocitrina]
MPISTTLDVGGGRGFAQPYGPRRERKKIILCFDGTGNKFSGVCITYGAVLSSSLIDCLGTDADSNILKIYRMLDRSNGLDAHYYQPGIGTYVNTHNLSHTSLTTRINSWYQKAKDSAVGTSFDSHVMGGYKFLMRCYQDDDIFLFGFSRGAYVARFLAEMLDHVGLLSKGNEEMYVSASGPKPRKISRIVGYLQLLALTQSLRAYFAWKAFAQWQERQDDSDEDKKKKHEMHQFLKAFRETFSRPVRRVRFMGLFDTEKERQRHHRHLYHHQHGRNSQVSTDKDQTTVKDEEDVYTKPEKPDRFRRPSQIRHSGERADRRDVSRLGDRLTREDMGRMRSLSPMPAGNESISMHTAGSQISLNPPTPMENEDEIDELADQDIEELWFPGCHADLGGGWPLGEGEQSALSHGPLVWMVREAQRAGLELDRDKMMQLHCCDEDPRMLDARFSSTKPETGPQVPTFEVTAPSQPDLFRSPRSEQEVPGWHTGMEPESPQMSEFHKRLHHSATKGVLHDCLQYHNGLPRTSVLSWKLMEYMPFRRMDLKEDGSWQAITFPLPMGEVRDIPEDAKIHHSALRRMEANEDYRPGNLIVGGGGRGVRKAPKELGIGKWTVHKNKGDPVGEVLVRERKSVDEKLQENGK